MCGCDENPDVVPLVTMETEVQLNSLLYVVCGVIILHDSCRLPLIVCSFAVLM
jgi:hypothetical protein